MSLVRILRTAQVTLSHTFFVDETATDASGPVTYAFKRLDGTSVASGTAAHPGSPGVYTAVLPGQAELDTITLDWTGTIGGAAVTVRDFVEIVGGFLFGLAEARAMRPPLSATTYPAATLAARRIEVEQECEAICRKAFVPRFARYLLDGSGTDELVLPDMQVRAVRSAKVAVRAGGTFIALSVDQVAAVAPDASGVLVRDDGDVWPRGRKNVLVEYEHGLDYPPEEVRTAAMLRLRSRLGMGNTGVPDRAISFTVAEGGVYRLSTPGKDRTGVPDVDAAYLRHRDEAVWIA
jgi:hypothetical protein